MTTKITGLQALQSKLKRMPAEVRSAARQALAESADEIVATMKSLAPVSPTGSHGWQPGMLRSSIQATFGDGSVPKYAAFRARRGRRPININDPDLSVTITAGDSFVRYAHLVEFGTRPHFQPKRGRMHPGTKAQPFFYPAYRAHRKRVKARITRAINRAVKRLAASGGNGA